MARFVRMGTNFKAIVSWPGSSGPSRGNDTRERFLCLARGASPAGDSPHEAGYDSCNSCTAMLAPLRTSRPGRVTSRAMTRLL